VRSLCLAALVLLAALPRLKAESGSLSPRLQDSAAAYREGRYYDALRAAVAALDENPRDPTAKNYVWSITRKIQKEQTPAPLKPGESEKAVALAGKSLKDQRRLARETLASLEKGRRQTAARNPRDILEGLNGMDKLLGRDISSDLAGEQARAYQNEILNNLQSSLNGKVFIARKDQLRAQGYLAYFNGDWPKAVELWSLALKEDPTDKRLSGETATLRKLVDRRARDEKLDDLLRQARIHVRAGNWAQALKTWGDVSAIDPANEEARTGAAAARVAVEKTALRKRLKDRTEEGLAVYQKGDVFGAAQIWLEVLQEDPGFEEARAWLQHAGRKIKSSAAAPPSAPAAVPSKKAQLSPADPAQALEIYKDGVIQYSQDNVAQAVELWKKALALDPTLARAREALRQAQAELALQ